MIVICRYLDPQGVVLRAVRSLRQRGEVRVRDRPGLQCIERHESYRLLNFRGSEVENKPEVLHHRIECLQFLEESHGSTKPARLKICPAHLCQEAPGLRTTARKRSRTAAMQRQSKQRRGAEERNNERTKERKKERKKERNSLTI